MKRTIISIFLLGLVGVGSLAAQDGYWDRQYDRRDIQHDNARIAHERNEMNQALWYGDYGRAEHERRELRDAYRDRNHDYRDLRNDQREEWREHHWRDRDRDRDRY